MKPRTILLGIITIIIMFGFKAALAEKLIKHDGTISATVLPLDRSTAITQYETAIFGLG